MDNLDDIVCNLRYCSSQKSITTSLQISVDVTTNTLSSKDTYVIDQDGETSERSLNLGEDGSCTDADVPLYLVENSGDSVVSEENYVLSSKGTFTQTSKTIIQLAELDGGAQKIANTNSLETQTSLISISENKTVQYRIEVNSKETFKEILDTNRITVKPRYTLVGAQALTLPENDDNRNLSTLASMTEYDTDDASGLESSMPDVEKQELIAIDNREIGVINIEHDQTKDALSNEFNSSFGSDFEEDSLNVGRDKKSIESDIRNLPLKLFEYETVNIPVSETYAGPDLNNFSPLTPLTEETASRKSPQRKDEEYNSVENNKDSCSTDEKSKDESDNFVYNKSTIVNLRAENNPRRFNSENLKLPPIYQSCPSSPHLNSLFTVNTPPPPNNLYKSNTVNNMLEASNDVDNVDRREFFNKDLACGEGVQISERSEKFKKEPHIQLPPIHAEGSSVHSKSNEINAPYKIKITALQEHPESISIREKIRELKSSNYPNGRHCITSTDGSSSPGKSYLSHGSEESKLADIADRGCEALCIELIKRLHSSSWLEVMETLDDMPRMLNRFWNVISEQRIADLLRQINLLVDSPRTQVARSACKTISTILKITNYTKKPDFYECVSLLLNKTGSFSRPLRRAANLALDEIVCSVDISHSVTALCLHGTGHKSALVRSATARLLVVCSALGGGGRELLRARPVSAVTARKLAIRSLSLLLEDRNTDARKYAERLYLMLRPLPNFEAFFLTDLDVDTATQQMKKFDKSLCGLPKERETNETR